MSGRFQLELYVSFAVIAAQPLFRRFSSLALTAAAHRTAVCVAAARLLASLAVLVAFCSQPQHLQRRVDNRRPYCAHRRRHRSNAAANFSDPVAASPDPGPNHGDGTRRSAAAAAAVAAAARAR